MKNITIKLFFLLLGNNIVFSQKITIQFDSAPSTPPSVTKAQLKYNKDFAYSFTLDDAGGDAYTCALPVFKGPVAKEDRSKMNAVFIMQDAGLEKEFIELCKANGMVGIKGHRSVGGFRVSMYNALTIESVKVLTDLMKDFAQHKS